MEEKEWGEGNYECKVSQLMRGGWNVSLPTVAVEKTVQTPMEKQKVRNGAV